ncbi:MAG: hypothetical protein WBL70_17810 [Candidatus Acidiferrales bacterium]
MTTQQYPNVEALLTARFPSKHVKSLVDHFSRLMENFQQANWESAILKSGKFVEAALKAVTAHVGNSPPPARSFKVDTAIRGLEQTPAASASESLRLMIPRACRFVYEIASNRGARHDPEEVDPNQMDATSAAAVCSWVLAEMVRYAQKNSLEPGAAQEIIDGLSQKKFPAIENVDGRTYFHLKGLSARDVALLNLWRVHPRRMRAEKLIDAACRQGFSEDNARKGVSRLNPQVDDDGSGNLKLLAPGIKAAERLFGKSEPK